MRAFCAPILRQRQLHIAEYGLMRNQVVTLEYKADGVIAVSIPIPVLKILCGAAVDDQVAFGVLIQTADDIEHRGFPTAGRAED